jgi:hypothetical protein
MVTPKHRPGKKAVRPMTALDNSPERSTSPVKRQFPGAKNASNVNQTWVVEKRLGDQEKRLAEMNHLQSWREENRPATSMKLNPNRLTSSIDFASFGQAANRLSQNAATPKPRGRRLVRKPESTIDQCLNRSVSPVPPKHLIGLHKVTNQSTHHVILATKQTISELN